MTTLQAIADKVRAGGRVDADEASLLYHEAPTTLLGDLADGIRQRRHPGTFVTYIIDRNVNYTNVCVARCAFCAFYRHVGSSEGYVLGFDEIFDKFFALVKIDDGAGHGHGHGDEDLSDEGALEDSPCRKSPATLRSRATTGPQP